MFFIFGSPRSGTTLLAQCLSAHPDLVVPAETDFIVPAAFVFDRVEDVEVRKTILKPLIANAAFTRAALGEYLSEEKLGEIVSAHCESATSLLDAIYTAVATAAGAKLAGDKTPNDLLYLRILISTGVISSDTKIIHIVRDVRDVVSSLIKRSWTPAIEDYFPRLWSQTNLYLHEQFGSGKNYRLIRYEDFVRDPEDHLREICGLLGVDSDHLHDMIAPKRRHRRYFRSPNHPMLYDPISVERIGAFRADLSPAAIETCHRQAADAMTVFAYGDR